uniref:Uncharacterized protein n=1 Tax=Anguilla anguilla TaxID=7936 RepID=A0A0E9U7S5_ANGAN
MDLISGDFLLEIWS